MSNFTKLLVLLFVIQFVAMSSDDAMFGLQWNMSPKQVEAMGVNLIKKEVHGNLHIYETDSLPKQVSVAESYVLLFDEDSQLVKIRMNSMTISSDIYGTEGKERFDELLTSLKKKYKVKDTYCYVGNKLYDESDEFYQCLMYDGCGTWASFLEGDKSYLSQKNREAYIIKRVITTVIDSEGPLIRTLQITETIVERGSSIEIS